MDAAAQSPRGPAGPPSILDDAAYVAPARIRWTQDRLGAGTFGTVYRGFCDGEPCALKCAHAASSPTQQLQLVREVRRYTRLRNPNITLFMGVSTLDPPPGTPLTVDNQPQRQIVLISELMAGGSLADALTSMSANGAYWATPALLRIASQMARGLRYIHAENCSHGDIKPQNVLLSDNVFVEEDGQKEQRSGKKKELVQFEGRAKWTDFGLSRSVAATNTTFALNVGPAGTVAYLAPEAFEGIADIEAAKRADIFSFGVLLWELATRELPYKGKSIPQIYKTVCELKQRPEWPREAKGMVPERWIALVERCWAHDPKDRPTIEEVSDEIEAICALEFSADRLAGFTTDESSPSSAYSTGFNSNVVDIQIIGQFGPAPIDAHTTSILAADARAPFASITDATTPSAQSTASMTTLLQQAAQRGASREGGHTTTTASILPAAAAALAAMGLQTSATGASFGPPEVSDEASLAHDLVEPKEPFVQPVGDELTEKLQTLQLASVAPGTYPDFTCSATQNIPGMWSTGDISFDAQAMQNLPIPEASSEQVDWKTGELEFQHIPSAGDANHEARTEVPVDNVNTNYGTTVVEAPANRIFVVEEVATNAPVTPDTKVTDASVRVPALIVPSVPPVAKSFALGSTATINEEDLSTFEHEDLTQVSCTDFVNQRREAGSVVKDSAGQQPQQKTPDEQPGSARFPAFAPSHQLLPTQSSTVSGAAVALFPAVSHTAPLASDQDNARGHGPLPASTTGYGVAYAQQLPPQNFASHTTAYYPYTAGIPSSSNLGAALNYGVPYGTPPNYAAQPNYGAHFPYGVQGSIPKSMNLDASGAPYHGSGLLPTQEPKKVDPKIAEIQNLVDSANIGRFSRLVEIMRFDQQDFEIQRAASIAMAKMLSSENLRKHSLNLSSMSRETLGEVMVLIHRFVLQRSSSATENAVVISSGCLALGNLVRDPRSIEILGTSRNIVKDTVNAMVEFTNNPTVQEKGSYFLAVAASSPEGRSLVGSLGGVSAALNALRVSAARSDAVVAQQALAAVRNFLWQSEENANEFHRSNGVDPLIVAVNMAKSGKASRDFDEEACGVLAACAFYPGLREQIGVKGGSECIVALMQRKKDDMRFQLSSCIALGNLSVDNPANAQRILACGGVEVVMVALRMYGQTNPNVLVQALRALRCTSESNPESRKRIASNGFFTHAKTLTMEYIMGLGNMYVPVLEELIGLFAVLSADPDLAKECKDSGVLTLITKVRDKDFFASPGLQESCKTVLSNMKDKPGGPRGGHKTDHASGGFSLFGKKKP